MICLKTMVRCGFLFFFFCSFVSLKAAEPYEVQISGVEGWLLERLERGSKLIHLKESPPLSRAALERRIEKDVAGLARILHSFALYNATISTTIEEKETFKQITIVVDPGEVYPISLVEIIPNPLHIHPADIGLVLGEPALPKQIIDAEERLLFLLAQGGYPLATVEGLEVIVDQKNHSVSIFFTLETHGMVTFGPIEIIGLREVCPEAIYKRVHWQRGQRFDPTLVDCTLEELDRTGLFRSVSISQGKELVQGSELPIMIELVEDKQRSIGGGISYSTQRGAGINAEWEHRNVRGLGERFSFIADLLAEAKDINILYVVPQFLRKGQDFVLRSEYQHDDTKGFEEKSVTLAASLERELNRFWRSSSGVTVTQLRSLEKETRKRENFNLVKLPLYLRFSNVANRLDPIFGTTFYCRLVPTIQTLESCFFYASATATLSNYFPSEDRRVILATKASLGTILGTGRSTIPPSERFYLGSESTLRGYEYYTVSPLGKEDKPIGGRSYLLFSTELRWRIDQKFGLVAFHDLGKVSKEWNFSSGAFRNGIGFGMRYFTDVGPLRLDFAIPLNRRKEIDDRLEIYFSVGQAF